MKKVSSVAHALAILGQNIDFDKMRELMPHLGVPAADIEPMIAGYQLDKIFEANNLINDNWKADWGDSDQDKWTVWKGTENNPTKPSGSGFQCTRASYWDTCACVGARRTVGTEEEALYIGEDFEDLFEIAWFIIPPESAEPATEPKQ